MKRNSMYEILEAISKQKTSELKINALRTYCDASMKALLKYALDPNIRFLLPEGDTPYKPCDQLDQHGRLFTEIRRIYLFIENGHPTLKQRQRETLWIQLLESLEPNDAILMNHVKDKKLPFKGITAKLVNEAWPGIISEKEKKAA